MSNLAYGTRMGCEAGVGQQISSSRGCSQDDAMNLKALDRKLKKH